MRGMRSEVGSMAIGMRVVRATTAPEWTHVDRSADGRSNRMRQRRRCAGICRRSRVDDAFGDGQQQRGWHQRRLTVGDTSAVAMTAAVVAAIVVGRCRRRGRHRIVGGCCRRHVFVARWCFGSGCRNGFGMRTARLQRCHRRADAVRHEGEAEQDVQQERVQAHAAESTPVADQAACESAHTGTVVPVRAPSGLSNAEPRVADARPRAVI